MRSRVNFAIEIGQCYASCLRLRSRPVPPLLHRTARVAHPVEQFTFGGCDLVETGNGHAARQWKRPAGNECNQPFRQLRGRQPSAMLALGAKGRRPGLKDARVLTVAPDRIVERQPPAAGESPRLRRGACLACAMKEDRSHLPDLIERIADPSDLVVRAARAALKSMSGKDFGPPAGADEATKAKAAQDWKTWYETEGK